MHHNLFMNLHAKARWAMAVIAVLIAVPLHAQTTPTTSTDTVSAAGQPMGATAQAIPVNAPLGSNSGAVPLSAPTTASADYQIAPNDLMEFDVFGVPT